TSVQLIRSTLPEAALAPESFDRIYCISTLEHLGKDEVTETLDEIRRVLKPDGLLILTVDLFLDVQPFTWQERNRWGSNVSLRCVMDRLNFQLVQGRMDELLGFDEFDDDKFLERLGHFFLGAYSLVSQILFLVYSMALYQPNAHVLC